MVSVHIRLPFPASRRASVSRRTAWAIDRMPHAKRELMKLCARIGYTPH